MIDRIRSSPVSHEARIYAVKELARRAGVSAADFRSWRITVTSDETVVFPHRLSDKRVIFAHMPSVSLEDARTLRTIRAGWMEPPGGSIAELVPDFVIPFSDAVTVTGPTRPLFWASGGDCIKSRFDLPLATLLTLSRYEEMLEDERDAHGRFPASRSLALRESFLLRPIVDEYGLGLEQALRRLLPGWAPDGRKPSVQLSHDMDIVGIPWNPKEAFGHTLRRRKPLSTVRDLLSPLACLNPVHLELVKRIVDMSLQHGLHSAVYWKASRRSEFDSGYDPRHPRVRRTISWLQERRVECGVHPGYYTFRRPEQLREEVQRLHGVLGNGPLGGRQHYLRWCPETWLHWEECGLTYDSTVGYADHIGFRAGTCFPYRPWLLWLNREADLVEIPLIVTDTTLFHYMKLSPGRALDAVLALLARCRLVGGVFTLLWHSSSLIEPAFAVDTYASILKALSDLHPPLDLTGIY